MKYQLSAGPCDMNIDRLKIITIFELAKVFGWGPEGLVRSRGYGLKGDAGGDYINDGLREVSASDAAGLMEALDEGVSFLAWLQCMDHKKAKAILTEKSNWPTLVRCNDESMAALLKRFKRFGAAGFTIREAV